MIGLIVSVIVWYELKGDTALWKANTNINEKLKGGAIEFSTSDNRPEKWRREQYSKKGSCEKNRNHGVSKGVKQNNVQIGRHTLKRLNCKGRKRGLEECRVLCERQMAKRRAHKHITQIKCALFNPQGQDYRFLRTTNQVIYNDGNQKTPDLFAMLLTMGIMGLASLKLNYRGLWKLKCQIVGTLIMLRIPQSKGKMQWPRVESSKKYNAQQALNIMTPLWLGLYVH